MLKPVQPSQPWLAVLPYIMLSAINKASAKAAIGSGGEIQRSGLLSFVVNRFYTDLSTEIVDKMDIVNFGVLIKELPVKIRLFCSPVVKKEVISGRTISKP